MEAALHPWPALGVLLLRDGLVSREDLERILVEQRDSRHQRISGWRLGEVLTDLGIVTQAQVAKLVAEQYELPFVELQETDIDLEATRLLSDELSRRFSALPIQTLDDGSVLLAVADPGAVLFSEELRRELAAPLRFAVVAQDALAAAVAFASREAQTVPATSAAESSRSGLAVDAHRRDHFSPLGVLLVRDGLVSEDELEAALTQQQITASKRLGEILVERGVVTQTDVARVVADQYELPFLDLVESEIDAQAAALLPADVAQRYEAIPTGFRDDGSLRVAIADPTRVVHSDEVLLALGVPVSFSVASPDAIAAAIESHYGRVPSTLEAADVEVSAETHEPMVPVGERETGAIDEILMEAAGAVAETIASEGHPVIDLDEDLEPHVTEESEETVPATMVEAVDPTARHEVPEPSEVSFTDRAPGVHEVSLVGDESTDLVAEPHPLDESVEEPTTGATLASDLRTAPGIHVTPAPAEFAPAAPDEVEVVAPDELVDAAPGEVEAGHVGEVAEMEAIGDLSDTPEVDKVAETAIVQDMEDFTVGIADVPAISEVDEAIARALAMGASDIHFTPQPYGLVVRARIDGVMREIEAFPSSLQTAVASRLKVIGQLDVEEWRAPQDGRIVVHIGGDTVDLRIVVLPTKHGEKVTLHTLHQASTLESLADLSMPPDSEEALRRAILQPSGAVLVCGPDGSGRTTTLYAGLQELNTPERTLTTIEDPVERLTPGIDQIEVDPLFGLTFAGGLRAILHSDSDVILVGEIRDEETAQIAVRAAMTGHLVLSTLHTQTAASAVQRLTDMEIEPGLLGATLTCLVAQRLVRRVCTDCRETYYATTEELAELGRPEEEPGTRLLARGRGCPACGGTGYGGRVGLFEVLTLTDEIRELIAGGASTTEIHRMAVGAGMRTLREDGIRLCLEGVTTPSEVRRVLGDG